MPKAIDPEKLVAEVKRAKEIFDPEIHGRHDLAAMPKYPLDEWFDSPDSGSILSEIVGVSGGLAEPSPFYYEMVERLMRVLNPAEKAPYLSAWRFITGKDPLDGSSLNDYWNGNEVGSVFIWFSYSPETCRRAAEAVSRARFIDLLQTAYNKGFIEWGQDGRQVITASEFWQLIRGVRRCRKSDHSMAKLSYGGGV
jgi:hypothetical protein